MKSDRTHHIEMMREMKARRESQGLRLLAWSLLGFGVAAGILVPASVRAGSDLDEATLEAIRRVVDPAQHASLLLDALQACHQAHRCQEGATDRLREIATAIHRISDPFRKVDLMLRLSRLEQQLGLFSQASNTRTEARQVVMASDHAERGALLLKLGLAAEDPEDSGEGERLLAEAAERMDPPSASRLSFPFKPLPARVKLGFAVSGTTFRDDTALGACVPCVGVNPWGPQPRRSRG